MEEAIEIMRLTSSREGVSYDGKYSSFRDLTILPRPVQQPLPIWVTANPRLPRDFPSAFRRVAKLGDGWMTTGATPETLRRSLTMIRSYADELGRKLPANFEVCLYYNINVNEDREAALAESKRFLDAYYTTDYSREFLESWVAMGSPAQCIENIRGFIDAGATTITLRITGYDQKKQFKRVTQEVLAALT
jgi:alkanesulfonate monooxygenase SsuD/methylene tetrahydromethanopterin reductase-like flavin-dependent oxidoreductase (luciferase family)